MQPHELFKSIVEQSCKATGTKKKYWAERCGFNETQFSLLINGRKTITYTDIEKFCIGMNILPNEVFPKSENSALEGGPHGVWRKRSNN